jgi:adenylylsulfate kinase-like enzyme
LTGLSGSGKTTTAEALKTTISDRERWVTVLAGDMVRRELAPNLG